MSRIVEVIERLEFRRLAEVDVPENVEIEEWLDTNYHSDNEWDFKPEEEETVTTVGLYWRPQGGKEYRVIWED